MRVVTREGLGDEEEMPSIIHAKTPIADIEGQSSLEEDYPGGVWSAELQQAFDKINLPLPTQGENEVKS